MFLLFDARCSKCGNHFKAEADFEVSEKDTDDQYQYQCPRCYSTTTTSTNHGLISESSTQWAVRAIPAGRSPITRS